MKAWWAEKAWPWLKENWWVLLALPLALLVVIAMFVHGLMRGRVSIIDPVEGADERATEEAARREEELRAEVQRLQEERDEIRAKYDDLQEKLEERLQDQVEELRDDPEKLRRLMLGINE